jgi:hypothetical protein
MNHPLRRASRRILMPVPRIWDKHGLFDSQQREDSGNVIVAYTRLGIAKIAVYLGYSSRLVV